MRAKNENPSDPMPPSKDPDKVSQEEAYNRWLKSGNTPGEGQNNSLESEQDAMKKFLED